MSEPREHDPLAFLGGADAGRAFLEGEHPSPVRDLLTWGGTEVPPVPGAYILMAREEAFHYPWAPSPVFYIGQSGELQVRLTTHRDGIERATNRRGKCVYRPRIEYGAAFGALFLFVPAGPGRSPKSLEDLLLALFARHHGSLPVANGAGAWDRIRGIIDRMEYAPHAPATIARPGRDRFGNFIGTVMAAIHNALTNDPQTPEEVSAATGDPTEYYPARCDRRLRELMKKHPECKIGEADGRFFIRE
jgi:hypothetical protein